MEDMARLALIEQSVRDSERFNNILCEFLQHIYQILENPHDYELRTIRNEILKKVIQHEVFTDYLKYIGFQLNGENITYPKEQTLNNLRIAQAAIERKIYFCCGTLNHQQVRITSGPSLLKAKRTKLTDSYVLTTNNSLLRQIQDLFNKVLVYENEELQELARKQIPVVTLQLMALDRVREYQRKIKTGEITSNDLSFDMALLMELLGWFKYKFFSWVDKPACELCGGDTKFVTSTTMTNDTETCKLELYKCLQCDGTAKFPRYNDVRTLLRTRRGRCGEWANCFTLLCRALGYDTRYVYDTTDHVWCEVYDYESNTWLHVDPCEAKLNAPLIYSHGWGKRLSYVIAVSKDDLQDVTWRYTTDHKEVLRRRNACDESELVAAILRLREHRQRQVSSCRQRYLVKRTLRELAQLMVEKKPTDYESHGRISGSKEWRTERREIGTRNDGHTFQFTRPGDHCIQYYASSDKYKVFCDGSELKCIDNWSAGVYECENIFKKTEKDWRMVYLAREEGATTGSVSWKLAINGDSLFFNSLSIKLISAVYENGQIDWTIKFDNASPISAKLGGNVTRYDRVFKEVVIKATLSGGAGDVAWQHGQLFRQPLDSCECALEIHAVAVTAASNH